MTPGYMDERLRITPITPETAGALWPYVRERLMDAERQTRYAAVPERVYAEWSAGRANVALIEWEGRRAGAVVLTGPDSSDFGTKRLWVWVLAVEGIAPVEMRVAINEWLKGAARRTGATAVGMASPREGWGRYLKSLGWNPVDVEYELEVNRG